MSKRPSQAQIRTAIAAVQKAGISVAAVVVHSDSVQIVTGAPKEKGALKDWSDVDASVLQGTYKGEAAVR